jgi:hypothetical protein
VATLGNICDFKDQKEKDIHLKYTAITGLEEFSDASFMCY